MTSFADMDLRTGQPIQLQLTRTDHARVYSLLIGYLIDRAIIVTMPPLSQSDDSIAAGDTFICRAFAGRRAYAFQTDVLRVALQPFPHLYLRYPQDVKAVVIRKATRVPFERAVSIHRRGAEGEASAAAMLRDLSLTGAGLEGVAGFVAAAESVELMIPGAGEAHPELRLKAIVRKVHAVDGAQDVRQSHFGLEFVELTPEHTRGLQQVIQHQLLDEA